VNTQGFQRVPEISGDDADDTKLLRSMAVSARDYITSFKWCPPISDCYLASGVGSVVALFLFKFAYKIQDSDNQLWVVVGDLPSAYLVVDADDSPQQAMDRYCELMEEWIAAVRDSASLETVFPVSAAPTVENAELLEKRIAFLVAEILPQMKA
jgi:hypothetical protein